MNNSIASELKKYFPDCSNLKDVIDELSQGLNAFKTIEELQISSKELKELEKLCTI